MCFGQNGNLKMCPIFSQGLPLLAVSAIAKNNKHQSTDGLPDGRDNTNLSFEEEMNFSPISLQCNLFIY